MSEYTPTTAEIREYVETGGEPRPWVELDAAEEAREAARAAAFDRWLTAHDAEMREHARHEFCDPRLGCVVADEPEWEYRIETGDIISYSHSKSRADRALVQGSRVWRRTPERRASSWVPVKQEGAETDV